MDNEGPGSVFVIDSDAKDSEFRGSYLAANSAQFELKRTRRILGHRNTMLKS